MTAQEDIGRIVDYLSLDSNLVDKHIVDSLDFDGYDNSVLYALSALVSILDDSESKKMVSSNLFEGFAPASEELTSLLSSNMLKGKRDEKEIISLLRDSFALGFSSIPDVPIDSMEQFLYLFGQAHRFRMVDERSFMLNAMAEYSGKEPFDERKGAYVSFVSRSSSDMRRMERIKSTSWSLFLAIQEVSNQRKESIESKRAQIPAVPDAVNEIIAFSDEFPCDYEKSQPSLGTLHEAREIFGTNPLSINIDIDDMLRRVEERDISFFRACDFFHSLSLTFMMIWRRESSLFPSPLSLMDSTELLRQWERSAPDLWDMPEEFVQQEAIRMTNTFLTTLRERTAKK